MDLVNVDLDPQVAVASHVEHIQSNKHGRRLPFLKCAFLEFYSCAVFWPRIAPTANIAGAEAAALYVSLMLWERYPTHGGAIEYAVTPGINVRCEASRRDIARVGADAIIPVRALHIDPVQPANNLALAFEWLRESDLHGIFLLRSLCL